MYFTLLCNQKTTNILCGTLDYLSCSFCHSFGYIVHLFYHRKEAIYIRIKIIRSAKYIPYYVYIKMD